MSLKSPAHVSVLFRSTTLETLTPTEPCTPLHVSVSVQVQQLKAREARGRGSGGFGLLCGYYEHYESLEVFAGITRVL